MCLLLSRYQFKGTLAFFKSHHKVPILIISRRSFRSSSETYFHLIETYGRDRALQQGKKLHAHLIINGLARLTHFASKLISFYVETKQLYDARKLFDKIPESNIRRWIVLIGAYSRRGLIQEALSVFSEMQKQGLGANKFVIPSVLKCCGHVYDVQTGRILHSVILKYSIESDVYVISSLIDMYSKCGEVEKARRVFDRMVEKDLVALNAMLSGYGQHGFANDMIKKMPVKPDLFVWGALLGACRNHGDIGLAEVAARHLAELEPENAGNNMLMSNLYADAGSWENVSRSKKMMKRKRLKNFPGCSWIEEAT